MYNTLYSRTRPCWDRCIPGQCHHYWQTIPGSQVHLVLFSCLFFCPVLSILFWSNLCKSCPMYVTLFSLLACFIVFYCVLLCLLGELCSRALVTFVTCYVIIVIVIVLVFLIVFCLQLCSKIFSVKMFRWNQFSV